MQHLIMQLPAWAASQDPPRQQIEWISFSEGISSMFKYQPAWEITAS